MEEINAIGLMSGTSLDGLDLAFASFQPSSKGWEYKGLITKSVDYDSVWKKRLTEAFYSSEKTLKELDEDFGVFLGEETQRFIEENGLIGKVDLVASHGHTIFHEPHKGFTLQIGKGEAIRDIVKCTVVYDFRSKDVALGGQGAPLVPIGDQLLFHDCEACLNLGGIANISYDYKQQRIAFDISPANLPLNQLMRDFFQTDFDKNGQKAKNGRLILQLKKELDELAYYKKPAPKSLGVEWLNESFYPIINKYVKNRHQVEDVLHTIVQHETDQIAQCVNSLKQINTVLTTGGGAFNQFFIEALQQKCKANIQLPDSQTIAFKEALVFAFLGVLKKYNKINTLSSVTGAKTDSSGGVLLPYPF